MLIIEDHKPLRKAKVKDISMHNESVLKSGNVYFGDNLADVVRWIEETPRVWGQHTSKEEGRGEKWDLGVGYHGALALAKDGWSEGAQNLFDNLRATPAPTGKEARFRYDVAGELPDVARFLSGDPMNMRGKGKVKGRAPVLHVAVNGTASGGTSAKCLANYGAALVAMVDRLEASGRRVELDVLSCGIHNNDFGYSMGWNVKKASEPVDLAAIAFSIAHPASFRRIGFAIIERMPKECESYGYGKCGGISANHLPDPAANIFLLDGIGHRPDDCATMEKAIVFAAKQINKAAGEILIELSELEAA